MNAFTRSAPAALLILAGPALQAQELSPRIGINAYFTQPADTAGKIYSSGWKVNLAIHVRRESEVEGRLRLEAGEFREGKEVERNPYSVTRYSASTRLVGYDWLIPFGPKRETGVDLILGIGGAHWFRERRTVPVMQTPYPWYDTSTTQHELAFAGTVGLRFRLSRAVALEIHHVLTSLPGSDRDFEDAELSHTAVGVGVRF
ncbi:MAG: hypothetical protein U0P81_12715 [Holophagaceae bacterium]